MTMKRVELPVEASAVAVLDVANLPTDFKTAVKFSAIGEAELPQVAALRANSEPWKGRGETEAESLEALTKLRPFIHVGRLQNHVIGYVTMERDGPVPGAAYMRNIVVKTEFQRKGLGTLLLNHAVEVAKEMYRKTLALRVDPSNAPAVSFYRYAGFTTVATVVSKKSGKLRLLMSREL